MSGVLVLVRRKVDVPLVMLLAGIKSGCSDCFDALGEMDRRGKELRKFGILKLDNQIHQ